MAIYEIKSAQNLLIETDAVHVFTDHLVSHKTASYNPVIIEYKGYSAILEHERTNRGVYLEESNREKNKVNNVELSSRMNELESTPNIISDSIKIKVDEYNEDLDNVKKISQETIAYWHKFKLDNDIERQAIYPKDRNKIFLLIFSMIIIEGILNSFFFAQASSSGLIGGLAIAIGLSSVNVLIAVIAALGLHRSNHKQPKTSLFGWLFLVLAIVVACILALLVGHYRTALDLKSEQPKFDAVKSIIESPFGIQTFDSWILVIFSIIIFLVAAWKWYKNDDAYPGFGDIDRRKENAYDIYSEQRVFTNEQLEKLKNEQLHAFKLNVAKLHEEFNRITYAKEQYERHHHEFTSFLKSQISEYDTFCYQARELFSDKTLQILELPAVIDKEPKKIEFDMLNSSLCDDLNDEYHSIKIKYDEFVINELSNIQQKLEGFVLKSIEGDGYDRSAS